MPSHHWWPKCQRRQQALCSFIPALRRLPFSIFWIVNSSSVLHWEMLLRYWKYSLVRKNTLNVRKSIEKYTQKAAPRSLKLIPALVGRHCQHFELLIKQLSFSLAWQSNLQPTAGNKIPTLSWILSVYNISFSFFRVAARLWRDPRCFSWIIAVFVCHLILMAHRRRAVAVRTALLLLSRMF